MTPATRRTSPRPLQKRRADTAETSRASVAVIHPRAGSALDGIAAQTVKEAVGGFEPAFGHWAAHYGLSMDGPDFAGRLFALIAKNKRIADGELPNDVPLILKSNFRAAAAYAFYQAVVHLPERDEIEIDIEAALGINRARIGVNYFLHLCLRAFMQYKKVPTNSRTSVAQYWYRDGLALRYAIRMNIKPSEMVGVLRQPSESVSAWVRDQLQYERDGKVLPPPKPSHTPKAIAEAPDASKSTITRMSVIVRELNPKTEKYSFRKVVVTNQPVMHALMAVLSIGDDDS